MTATNVAWLIVLVVVVAAVVLYLVRSKPGLPPNAKPGGDGAGGSGDAPSPAPASDTRKASPMSIEADPLGAHFEVPSEAPKLADSGGQDSMSRAGSMVTLPNAWAQQLLSQGLDPSEAAAGDMVLGVLRAAGYSVNPTGEHEYQVSKGASTTYVMVDPYEEGGYPEMDEDAMTRFVMTFANSKADKGLYVTDKFAPFAVYEREKRDTRIRFVSRERLQQFVSGITGA